MKKAVVLFSGGLDSTTCLAYAKSTGYECHALSFNYDQRHGIELEAAKKIASALQIEHHIFNIALNQLSHSALTDLDQTIPDYQPHHKTPPITYVPARNTIFLSIALSLAETINAKDIFIGVSQIDYSGYPDCRPEYIACFQQLANLATQLGVQEGNIRLHTPLINLTKAETILLGHQLGVNYAETISCYQANGKGEACGRCDSCILRKKGFAEAQVKDPTTYIK